MFYYFDNMMNINYYSMIHLKLYYAYMNSRSTGIQVCTLTCDTKTAYSTSTLAQ